MFAPVARLDFESSTMLSTDAFACSWGSVSCRTVSPVADHTVVGIHRGVGNVLPCKLTDPSMAISLILGGRPLRVEVLVDFATYDFRLRCGSVGQTWAVTFSMALR